jgi:ElaB/YqjD/DUF883 family membrane-anchored ribosome-binding protein
MDHAVQSADEVVHNTQRLANQAVDGVSKSFRSAGQQVRDGAHLASDKTVAYIRDEPVKSMLMDAKKGQRIADNCMHPAQVAETEAAQAPPTAAQ